VTNTTFIFETSPNTKPKEKKFGGHSILCPPRLKKWGGHVPLVPHQIAPMAQPKHKERSWLVFGFSTWPVYCWTYIERFQL